MSWRGKGIVLLVAGLIGTAQAEEMAGQSQHYPLAISRATLIGHYQTDIYGGAFYGLSRQEKGSGEYDNFRVGPVGVRHGLTEQFEYGAYFNFVRNQAQDKGAPDESGYEGLKLYGKLAVNQHAALEFGANVNGDDDVRPYPSDGVDFFVNLPMQRTLGDSLIYGELGYTIKDKDSLGVANYLNWGIGYAYPLDKEINLEFELVGDENPSGNNHTELLFGASAQLGRINMRPYMGIGVYEASPQLSMGFNLSWRL